MQHSQIKADLDRLFSELSKKLEAYHDAVRKDDIFEVKRKIRHQIRELEKNIEQLKNSQNYEQSNGHQK